MKVTIGIIAFILGFAAACLTVKNRVVPTKSEIAGNMAKEGVEKGIVKIKEKLADREESRNATLKKEKAALEKYAKAASGVLEWVPEVLDSEGRNEFFKKMQEVPEGWTIIKTN